MQSNTQNASREELLARIAELEAQQSKPKTKFSVSQKGAISLNTIRGRFPVTLYATQILGILADAAELKTFIHANVDGLNFKTEELREQVRKLTA